MRLHRYGHDGRVVPGTMASRSSCVTKRSLSTLVFIMRVGASCGSAVPPLRRAPPSAELRGMVTNQAFDTTAQPAYDWLRNWYPVNVLATMDHNRDHRFQLLGLNLIAGRTHGADSWIVADDLTPPRSKPLTVREKLPLLEPRTAPVGPSSGGGRYPVFEADGLLWVFPYSGPDAESVAAEVPLSLIDELHDPALEGRWKWKIPAGVRDFPCG